MAARGEKPMAVDMSPGLLDRQGPAYKRVSTR